MCPHPEEGGDEVGGNLINFIALHIDQQYEGTYKAG
jgi:hypothetical protein